MSLTLGELAVRFGWELRGDPDARVDHVATLEGAGPGALCFFANPRLAPALRATRASAVIVDAASAGDCPVAALVAERPHVAFAHAAALLHPRSPALRGPRHPSAVVAADAGRRHGAPRRGARSSVHARASVRAPTSGPGCVIGEGVEVGADVRLVARSRSATASRSARAASSIRVR
ncbi:MAG: LpxD N-terminal domain-containing protein [Steroidobacteraceae bacterium]